MLKSVRLGRSLFITCLTLSIAAGSARAIEPAGKDLDAAIAAGDLTGYSAKLSAWLVARSPAAGSLTDEAATALLADPAFAIALNQRRLIAVHGADQLDAFIKAAPANRDLLASLLRDRATLDLYLDAAGPKLPIDALDRLRRIVEADPDAKSGLYQRLAIAVAQANLPQKSYGSGVTIEWMPRYQHYKTAHAAGELFPSFDALSVWDLKHVVNSWASDRDLAWVRQMIRTWRPDLLTDTRVVNIVSEVWRRNSPFPFSDGFVSVLAGGGKCGPRSWFGEMTCKAFGLPAMAVPQPGHSAVAYKSPDPAADPQPGSPWKVCYGAGWHKVKHGYPMLLEAALRDHPESFARMQRLRWLADAMPEADARAAALLAIADRIDQAILKPGEGSNPAVAEDGQPIPFAKANPVKPVSPPADVPETPAAPQPGVIHVEAEAFAAESNTRVLHCVDGGKQVNFQKNIDASYIEYAVDVPAAGTYALTLRIAAANFDQSFAISVDGAPPIAVNVPNTTGLWDTTEPVDLALTAGKHTLRIAAGYQRGVAVRWLELRAK